MSNVTPKWNTLEAAKIVHFSSEKIQRNSEKRTGIQRNSKKPPSYVLDRIRTFFVKTSNVTPKKSNVTPKKVREVFFKLLALQKRIKVTWLGYVSSLAYKHLLS